MNKLNSTKHKFIKGVKPINITNFRCSIYCNTFQL